MNHGETISMRSGMSSAAAMLQGKFSTATDISHQINLKLTVDRLDMFHTLHCLVC